MSSTTTSPRRVVHPSAILTTFLLFLTTLLSTPAHAQSPDSKPDSKPYTNFLRDSAHRFTVYIPDSWRFFTGDESSTGDQDFGTPDTTFAKGFTPAADHDPRLAIVTVTPADLTRETYETLEQSLEVEGFNPAPKPSSFKPKPNTISRTAFDRSLNRATFTYDTASSSGEPVKCLSFTFLGSDRFVHLRFFAPADQFESSRPEFQRIADAFSLDNGSTFDPKGKSLYDKRPRGVARLYWSLGIFIVLLVGGFVWKVMNR